MSQTRAYLTIRDYNGEVSTTSFNLAPIAVDGSNMAATLGKITAVKNSVNTVIAGEVIAQGFTRSENLSFADVTDPQAQRERKWLVVYRDTTPKMDAGGLIDNLGFGKLFTLEVATADLAVTDILKPNSDEMDITAGAGASFVGVLEANITSPYNATAAAPSVSVVRVVHVGRNS